MKGRIVLGIGIVFLALFLVSWYLLPNNDLVSPRSGVILDLIMDDPPSLGETSIITAKLSFIPDIKDNMPPFFLNISLPEGLELIQGTTILEGKLEKEIIHTITVKSVKTGNWTVDGTVRIPPRQETYIGARDWIYLIVTKDDAWINDHAFKEERECPQGVNCTTSSPSN